MKYSSIQPSDNLTKVTELFAVSRATITAKLISPNINSAPSPPRIPFYTPALLSITNQHSPPSPRPIIHDMASVSPPSSSQDPAAVPGQGESRSALTPGDDAGHLEEGELPAYEQIASMSHDELLTMDLSEGVHQLSLSALPFVPAKDTNEQNIPSLAPDQSILSQISGITLHPSIQRLMSWYPPSASSSSHLATGASSMTQPPPSPSVVETVSPPPLVSTTCFQCKIKFAGKSVPTPCSLCLQFFHKNHLKGRPLTCQVCDAGISSPLQSGRNSHLTAQPSSSQVSGPPPHHLPQDLVKVGNLKIKLSPLTLMLSSYNI